LYLNKTIFMIH